MSSEEKKKLKHMTTDEIVQEFTENGEFQQDRIVKSIHSSMMNAAQTFMSGIIKLSVYFIEQIKFQRNLEKRVENLEKQLQNANRKS